MKVHYPKLYNMAHILSLNVFTASKGSNNYILFFIGGDSNFQCARNNVMITELIRGMNVYKLTRKRGQN